MGKLIVFNMVTVDGFFEGPSREIDWHLVDEEFQKFAKEQLNQVEVLVFGRVTYDLMYSYWPSEDAIKNDPEIAGIMNQKRKIVFSKKMKTADWNNSELIKENIVERMLQLKQGNGGDLMILGSAAIMSLFANHSLIDEYRIIINPVLLGKGNPMFKGINKKLKLIRTKVFKSGNVLLSYSPGS